MKEGGCS